MLDRLTIERMASLSGERPIAVAVSGGGDSVALLSLLQDAFGHDRLHALIVDHGLRAGSAADAAAARANAESLGVRATRLSLDWQGAPRRSQAAARKARHKSLARAASELRARILVLGHTADDQAETVLLRGASGSGWRGLAGMAALAPAPVWPEGEGVVLARPLLAVRRQELRELLRARRLSWLEDPANADPGFQRVRVRARLAALEPAGLDPIRLVHLAERLRGVAAEVDAAAASLIAQAVRFEGPEAHVAQDAWRGDGEVRRRSLGVLLQAVAGAERAPDPRALARLESHMTRPGFRGATLAGAAVRACAAGVVAIGRDLGALRGRSGGPKAVAPLPLVCGRRLVWDGRAALTARVEGLQAVAGPSGEFIVTQAQSIAPEGAVAVEWLIEAHARHLLSIR